MNDSLISSDDNRRMFDDIAEDYDLMNRLMSFGLDGHWRRRSVQALAPKENQSYLDMGCGTGAVILEILRQSPNSQVTGLDPSEHMLQIARAKLDKENLLDRATLVTGDALSLKYDDHAFSGTISAFCIRNITDRRKALSEMFRTLTPGGRLVLLELTATSHPIMRPLYSLHARYMMPLIGRLAGNRNAYTYLTESIEDFTQRGAIELLMTEVGFSNLKTMTMTSGTVTVFYGERPE